MKKAHSEKVNPQLARIALMSASQRTHLWTEYILVHFRTTGDLAPGCDYRDLSAWCEQHMPMELAAITRK